MSGRYGETTVKEDIGSTVPKDKTASTWDAEELSKVLAVSEEWGPEFFPNPVAFRGKNLFGLIAGRAS
jgi:hypothetical protein